MKISKNEMNKLHVQATRAFVNTFKDVDDEINAMLLLVNKALDEYEKSLNVGRANSIEKKSKTLGFILNEFNKLLATYMN